MRTTQARFLPHAAPITRPGAGGAARLRGAVAGLVTALRRMYRLASTRRMLAEADDHTLADLGISRAQARFEAARRPWHWGPRPPTD